MSTNTDAIETLVASLPLGEGHADQERVVAVALQQLITERQRGIVLADEVGFGKTYEALAIASLLYADAKRRRREFDHVLVLCKPSLVGKWEEETSSAHADRGFPRYIGQHPARALFENVRTIDGRHAARALRRDGVRGQRLDGRNQVPPGLYVVNERLLQEEKRNQTRLLAQLWRTQWDLVIVDEAHHYARGNVSKLLFAPHGNLRSYDDSGLEFDRILALTATPFELNPHEMVNLLALIRAKEGDLCNIEAGLKKFVPELGRFFDLRDRPPEDEHRRELVQRLEHLRMRDACGGDATDGGLESLMRRYLLRNTKRDNERRYSLVEQTGSNFGYRTFGKLDENLQSRIALSPLIQFQNEHVLYYLQLRQTIQEVTDRARDGNDKGTFISVDLRQGLSSYPQLLSSKLLTREHPSAARLRKLVRGWDRQGRVHPKVAALIQLTRDIVSQEIDKLRGDPTAWFSKVLIFNKMIGGTAPHLSQLLRAELRAMLGEYLQELLAPVGLTRQKLESLVRELIDEELGAARATLAGAVLPGDLVAPLARYAGQPLVRICDSLRRKAVSLLALIDLVRQADPLDALAVRTWLKAHITQPVVDVLRKISPALQKTSPGEPSEQLERELVVVYEETRAVQLVGRFDGANAADRESHRRSFNQRYNPFILLVGQVGEEGIDLQKQCKYIIHYDLEWNPARMEQREGRVDRIGWNREAQGFIDVRFMLLKSTYEERIFHTVMRRDQWFQVLIGSKRRELGEMPDDAEVEVEQDRIEDGATVGMLTSEEKRRVMLDLRPDHGRRMAGLEARTSTAVERTPRA